MNNKTPHLDMILELTGAIGTHNLSNEECNRFKQDPHSFLAEHNINIGSELSIHAIENSANEINITLPFYSELDKSAAEKISDDNIKDVAGGEIFIYPTIAIAIAAAAGGTLYALSQNVKSQAKDITYKAITGEGDPNKKGK